MIQHIMHNGKSSMHANNEAITNISQNVVNANTSGYKRIESEFQTLLSSSLDKYSYPNYSENVATGNGIKYSNAFRDLTQGGTKKTENFSDFAIIGDGYFRVITSDGGYAYTRCGEFQIDGWGRLVDSYGNILDIEFEDGFSYDNFKFTEQVTGNVNSTGSSSTEGIDKNGVIRYNGQSIGKINLYKHIGSDDLRSIGDNLYIPKDGGSMIQSNSAYMRQGYVELSNVNLGKEMTDLISLYRAYQLAGKSITTADEMWALVNNI